MPKFELNIQGRKFEVEAPNKEALPEIAETIAGQIKPTQTTDRPDQFAGLGPFFSQQFRETEQKIQPRTDILKQFFTPGGTEAQKLLKRGLPRRIAGAPLTGLGLLGGVAQRGEAAIANPLLALQKRAGETLAPERGPVTPESLEAGGRKTAADTLKILKLIAGEAKKGITGERLGQLGDPARRIGLPEPVAGFIGLGSVAGISNVLTKNKIVRSANKATSFLKNRFRFKFMGKNFAINNSKKAISGLSELDDVLGNEYDDLYNKIGKQQVDTTKFNEIIDDLPENIIKKIQDSKLVDKLPIKQQRAFTLFGPKGQELKKVGALDPLSGLPKPTIKNIKTIKNIINKSVPKNVLNGGKEADLFQGQLKNTVRQLRDLAAEGNDELAALNRRYYDFKTMEGISKDVLMNTKHGVVKSKGIENLYKKGAERANQQYFEQFAEQWPQAKDIIRDMQSFTRRRAVRGFLGREALRTGKFAVGGAIAGKALGGTRELE